MTDLSPEQQEIKDYFIAERGYWRPWTETILRHNPQFLRRYASYAGYPARQGPLSKRMVELIYVALDASSTHLYAAGIRTHIDLALEHGATAADLLDVFHIVTSQGLEAVYRSVEILAEEANLPQAGKLPSTLRAKAASLFSEDARFIAILHQLDTDYLDTLLDFLGHDDRIEGLSASERILIEIALNACFTGHNAETLRRLMRVALASGITHAEILQCLQLGAHLSIHGAALGTTLLDERLRQGNACAV